MKQQSEINRGYIDSVRTFNRWKFDTATDKPSFLTRLRESLYFSVRKAVILCALLCVSVTLWIYLKLYLLIKRSRGSELYGTAVNYVDEFVCQYPFHLYPVVCKAIELAWLKEEIRVPVEERARIIEIAIGDGTLSARVFPPEAHVIALDLSPYSLKKASGKAHVRQAIISDCLNPSIAPGSFDLLIANNFLHHVTNKAETLANWSKLAEKAVFNENTVYWATGWSTPFVWNKLGRRDMARRAAQEIEEKGLQCLKSGPELDRIVEENYEILRRGSYMSERTFFLSGVFSFIMRCYGPPTPPYLKSFFLSAPLRWLTVSLTSSLAKSLIRYDEFQDRDRDTFVSYTCRSKAYVRSGSENPLACPDCARPLTKSYKCEACGRTFSFTDGMLFLLPKELEDLQKEYNYRVSESVPLEHL